MAGMLTLKDLQAAVAAGEIDTVIIAFTDMQGRLVGKRMQAEYFLEGAHEETHGCDYLLANDIDMEPVPGYAAANWEKGYGDFIIKPELATLRRLPWLPGTALVLADILDHHHHEDVAHSPRAMLNVMPDLASAMKYNPSLKVLLLGGYYDLATPFYEGWYEMHHLPMPDNLQSNISYHFFQTGHMVYVNEQALKELHDHTAQFIRDNAGVH